MNIKRAIHLLMQKISLDHKVSYLEVVYYYNAKCSKTYIINIDGEKEEFKKQTDLLLYLKGVV